MADDKKDRGPHCELSKQFTGVKRLIHEVLMETELYSGYGAYILNYADTGDPKNKSGLSFGVNQMDMSQRSQVVEIFKDILQNAKDNRGQYIIPRNKLEAIKNIKCNQIGKTPEQVYGKDLSFVNSALSSTYGIQKIDEIYIKELNKDIAHIEKAISKMKNPAAKEFYSSNVGKVFLFEFHNQFDLELDGSFMTEYIDGKYNKLKRTDYKTHKEYDAPITSYTLADHKKFIYGTYQYSKTPKMIDTRLEKAENTYNKYALLAFADDINQPDMQAEMVAIIDNYNQWFADLINKDILNKNKSEATLDNYLNELSAENAHLFKSMLLNEKSDILNDIKQIESINFESPLSLKADSNSADAKLSDNLEKVISIEDHAYQASLPEMSYPKESITKESELSKTSFLQKNETPNIPPKVNEILISEVLETKASASLNQSVIEVREDVANDSPGEIQNIMIQDPLKNFLQDGQLIANSHA